MRKMLTILLAACLLIPAALAESAWAPLPLDDVEAIPHAASPDHYIYNDEGELIGYEDETLTVTMEHIWVDDARFNVARITIVDPSQLRTGLAVPNARKTNKVSAIAASHNAVVAIGGDFFTKDKVGPAIRMGKVFQEPVPGNRTRYNRDMLFIDENGDFHILLKPTIEDYQAMRDSELNIINAFTFGPALVIDGEIQETDPEHYAYALSYKDARTAIGQIGPLEYLLVVVDGDDRAGGSKGCTGAALAQFMHDQGCVQAFNLDGGGSAYMYFGGANYSDKSVNAERSLSDIIYFGTLMDFGPDAEAK